MAETRRYVLWGSAGHAKVLDESIRQRGDQVVALFDNSPQASSALEGVELVGGINEFPAWMASRSSGHNLFGLVAIGGARGRDRLALQLLLARNGLRLDPLLHPRAFVAADVALGEGSQVLALALIAAGAQIGTACIINHKASVDHECLIGDGVHVAPGATLCGSVTIDNHVMIGAGAVVLPRLHIGRDSIIGAGAVVTRNVPDNVVVIGNPAKILRRLPQPAE